MKRFTLAELESMETRFAGHTDDMKYHDGTYQVWLSRMTVADGEPYNNKVTVERLEAGRWVLVDEYQAR